MQFVWQHTCATDPLIVELDMRLFIVGSSKHCPFDSKGVPLQHVEDSVDLLALQVCLSAAAIHAAAEVTANSNSIAERPEHCILRSRTP